MGPSGPVFVGLVKQVLEAGMNPSKFIYYRFCPVEVFPFAFNRPIGRRGCRDIAQVADLVGKLY